MISRMLNAILFAVALALGYLWATDEPIIQVEPTITVNPPRVETEITHPALSRDGAESALSNIWAAATGR